MNGWITLHRKLLESDVFQNEKLLKIFIYCLLKATHQDMNQLVGLQKVELKKGQFVFGRKKAAEELSMKESTVWKHMKVLEDIENITINSNNKFSVVTVVNWEVYQYEEQQNNNKITTKEQQNNTNNNNNNSNNIKSSRKHVFDDTHLGLAEYFYNQILANNPEHKKPNFEKWANDIRLMMERDNRTEAQIRYLMKWVQQDDFEMLNVLSPDKLRKRFDHLVMKVKQEKKTTKQNYESNSVSLIDEMGGL